MLKIHVWYLNTIPTTLCTYWVFVLIPGILQLPEFIARSHRPHESKKKLSSIYDNNTLIHVLSCIKSSHFDPAIFRHYLDSREHIWRTINCFLKATLPINSHQRKPQSVWCDAIIQCPIAWLLWEGSVKMQKPTKLNKWKTSCVFLFRGK